MDTDTSGATARHGATPSGAPSLGAGAELALMLDRLEARMEALQLALRTRRRSPRFELWMRDLHETRAIWHQLVDVGGQDHPTPERS